MGCCGGGYNPNGNNNSNNCHGGRGFNLLYMILIAGVAILILKAAL